MFKPSYDLNRRISDIIASAHYNVGICQPINDEVASALKKINIHAMKSLVEGKTTVVFADEIYRSISEYYMDESARNRELFVEIWKTPRPWPPFFDMFIEGNPWAKKEEIENDILSVGAKVESVEINDFSENTYAYKRALVAIKTIKDEVQSDELLERKIQHLKEKPPRGYVEIKNYTTSIVGNKVYGPLGQMIYFVDDDFEFYRIEGDVLFASNLVATIPEYTGSQRKLIYYNLYLAFAVTVKAIGLMNCSNVEIVEEGKTNQDIHPKQRRTEKLSWIKYHVLKIKSGKQYKPIDNGVYSGGNNPLHICRGHFRNYSEGKGLFGKYNKTAVWIPPHVRGREQDGIVLKDYEIA